MSPAFSVASVTLAVIGLLRIVGRAHVVAQRAGQPAHHDMGVAQVGLGQRDQDRAVVLAGGEIDVADQPLEQAGAVEAGALLVAGRRR